MISGAESLLLLSMSLQQMAELPVQKLSPLAPISIMIDPVATNKKIRIPGGIWGTVGNEDNAPLVGLVYASRKGVNLQEFEDRFHKGTRTRAEIFLPGSIANDPQKRDLPDVNSGKNCSVVAWLYVPLYRDFVLVSLYWGKKAPYDEVTQIGEYLTQHTSEKCLRAPGVIEYVGGDLQAITQRGYFYWYSTWEQQKFPQLGTKIDAISPYPLNIKNTQGLLDQNNRHPNDAAVRRWIYHDVVDRNQAFEYVMCMPEIVGKNSFRVRLGIQGTDPNSLKSMVQKVKKGFPAIKRDIPNENEFFSGTFEKNFRASSIHTLREKYRTIMHNRAEGRLFVMKRNPYVYETDIRWLQANFPGAVFQIASTLTCLEGDVKNYAHPLDSMNRRPVQGENAVLGTISGAIVRRYFVPQHERNLLLGVGNIFQGAGSSYNPHIEATWGNFNYEALLKGSQFSQSTSVQDRSPVLYAAIAGGISVGMHQNIVVSSGSFGKHDIVMPRNDAPFFGSGARQVPAFDEWLNTPTTVHHIYTSAINLNERHLKKEYEKTPGKSEAVLKFLHAQEDIIPKIALRASYEGTILAACELLQKGPYAHPVEKLQDPALQNRGPRVFLTMVGAGAFQNKPEWIVVILQQLQALIKKSNLQIVVVVWEENPGPWINDLQQLARDINTNNIEYLTKKAYEAGERLWLFDEKANLTFGILQHATITLPIQTQDKKDYVKLNVW
jgi:hypothetical protein